MTSYNLLIIFVVFVCFNTGKNCVESAALYQQPCNYLSPELLKLLSKSAAVPDDIEIVDVNDKICRANGLILIAVPVKSKGGSNKDFEAFNAEIIGDIFPTNDPIINISTTKLPTTTTVPSTTVPTTVPTTTPTTVSTTVSSTTICTPPPTKKCTCKCACSTTTTVLPCPVKKRRRCRKNQMEDRILNMVYTFLNDPELVKRIIHHVD